MSAHDYRLTVRDHDFEGPRLRHPNVRFPSKGKIRRGKSAREHSGRSYCSESWKDIDLMWNIDRGKTYICFFLSTTRRVGDALFIRVSRFLIAGVDFLRAPISGGSTWGNRGRGPKKRVFPKGKDASGSWVDAVTPSTCIPRQFNRDARREEVMWLIGK